MNIEQIILLCLLAPLTLYAKFSIGKFFAASFKFQKISHLELTILGSAAFSLFLYSISRHALPAQLYLPIVFGVALAIFFALFSQFRCGLWKLDTELSWVLIGSGLVLLGWDLAPTLLNKQIFFQNWGPDLDGNVITAAYIARGGNFTSILSEYESVMAGNHWWTGDRTSPWQLPDQTNGIAAEFFLRSNRWGHAVEAAFISGIGNQPVWHSIKVLMLSNGLLGCWIIFEQCRARKLSFAASAALTILMATSGHVALQYYEGINVQFIFYPFLLYLICDIDDLLGLTFPKCLVGVAAISVLLISFGEAVQIYLLFFMSYLLLSYRQINWPKFLPTFIGLLGTSFVLFATPISDFAYWTILRAREIFDGGALHYPFFIPNVVLPVPYFIVGEIEGYEAIQLFFEGSKVVNTFSLGALSMVAYWLPIKASDKKILWSTSITLLVVILFGHNYALWKCCVIFAPIVASIWLDYSSGKSPKWALALICGVLAANILSAVQIVSGYSKISKPYFADQFEITGSPSEGCFGVITPSDDYSYIKLASNGQLHWINEAHRQFGLRMAYPNSGSDEKCKVYGYFDCKVETEEFCLNASKLGLQPYKFFETQTFWNDLIGVDKFLDKTAVSRLKSKIFHPVD